MSFANTLDALGDNPEYGGTRRVTLPKSSYVARLSVNDFNATPGGTPYVELLCDVLEGPFQGQSPRARVYITPGGPDSKGGHIAFVNAATKRVTGKDADSSALNEIKATMPPRANFPDGPEGDKEYREAARMTVRDAFAELTPEMKLAFAMKYARLRDWDNKTVVVVLGVEYNEDNTRSFNKINGFYALNDVKQGAEHVRRICHAEQQVVADEMAAAEVAGA